MPRRMRETLCVAFTCVALTFAVVHSTLRVYWTHVQQYRCAVITYQVLTKTRRMTLRYSVHFTSETVDLFLVTFLTSSF
jgi:uncharacterized membrane protein YhhN